MSEKALQLFIFSPTGIKVTVMRTHIANNFCPNYDLDIKHPIGLCISTPGSELVDCFGKYGLYWRQSLAAGNGSLGECVLQALSQLCFKSEHSVSWSGRMWDNHLTLLPPWNWETEYISPSLNCFCKALHHSNEKLTTPPPSSTTLISQLSFSWVEYNIWWLLLLVNFTEHRTT